MKHHEDIRIFLKTLGDTLQDDKSGISTRSGDTQAIADKTNAFIEERYTQGDTSGMDYLFNGIAAVLARANIAKGNGGPFGAVIVEYDKVDEKGDGIGKPRLLGVGANHVVPKSDPSAHAEMEAYRDAGERRQASDLKNCVMFTSCECCPMCLSNGNGSGIGGIVYSNDRGIADRINFDDEKQYKAFLLLREKQMTLIDKLDKPEMEKDTLRALLKESDAVVLDTNGNVYVTGNADTKTNPTGLASLDAIQKAVAKYAAQANAEAEQNGTNAPPVFGVPEGFTLVVKTIPHPAAFIASDWGNFLRKRGVETDIAPVKAQAEEGNLLSAPKSKKNSPWALKPKKKQNTIEEINPVRILHLTPDYEQLTVHDGKGNSRIAQRAEDTYIQPTLPDEQRAVPTRRCDNHEVNVYNQGTFLMWDRSMNARY